MSSPSPQEDLSYWIERCSICFDARLDLCLDYCRDQFCTGCFRRYVVEVVTSSWGLSVKKIKCPVCQIHIPQSEWSKYVPDEVVDLYNKYNRPYRSFARHCPRCETETVACEYTKTKTSFFHQRDGYRSKLVQKMIVDLTMCCKSAGHTHTEIQQLADTFEQQDWRNSTLLSLHKRTMCTLLDFVHKDLRDPAHTTKVYAISRQILLLDMKSETWKRLQFSHISFFPNVACPNASCCTQFCLQCGYETHPAWTCEENMQQLVRTGSNDMDPIKWKLENSKRCPSCSILITRDEGCNKVDCSLCGHAFCWVCGSSWSEKCGFYRCAILGLTSQPDKAAEVKAELGVPDMHHIQARIFSNV